MKTGISRMRDWDYEFLLIHFCQACYSKTKSLETHVKELRLVKTTSLIKISAF
jgi:hypothetical protein